MDFHSSNHATTSSYSPSEPSCFGSCSVNDHSRRSNSYPTHRAEFNETKSRLPKHWIDVLEDEFQRNQRPNTALKSALAKCMNVKEAQVINWFQNRRARFKRELRSRQQEEEWQNRMSMTAGWATDNLPQLDNISPCCQSSPQASYFEPQAAPIEAPPARQESQLHVEAWQNSTSSSPTPATHSQMLDCNAVGKCNDSACNRSCQDSPVFCIVLQRCSCDVLGQYRCAFVGAGGDMVYNQSHCASQTTPTGHESHSGKRIQDLSGLLDLNSDGELGVREHLASPAVGSQCSCCQAKSNLSSGTAPQQPASEPPLSSMNDPRRCSTTDSPQILLPETHARQLDDSRGPIDTATDHPFAPVNFHSTHDVDLYQDDVYGADTSQPNLTSQSSLSPSSTSHNDLICLAPAAGRRLGNVLRGSSCSGILN